VGIFYILAIGVNRK
jgi:outer membrane protein assembly factor BamB